jgi:hypothetical protein
MFSNTSSDTPDFVHITLGLNFYNIEYNQHIQFLVLFVDGVFNADIDMPGSL